MCNHTTNAIKYKSATKPTRNATITTRSATKLTRNATILSRSARNTKMQRTYNICKLYVLQAQQNTNMQQNIQEMQRFSQHVQLNTNELQNLQELYSLQAQWNTSMWQNLQEMQPYSHNEIKKKATKSTNETKYKNIFNLSHWFNLDLGCLMIYILHTRRRCIHIGMRCCTKLILHKKKNITCHILILNEQFRFKVCMMTWIIFNRNMLDSHKRRIIMWT